MAVQLVMGMMDLRVMLVLTAAITAERLAPGRLRAARLVGAVVAVWGLAMIVRAAS
jgi:predicted metal-binding membrane protein